MRFKKLEQKSAGEGPAGRKGDVTKVWYLLGRLALNVIYDDSEPTKREKENRPKVRGTSRATCKRFSGGP